MQRLFATYLLLLFTTLTFAQKMSVEKAYERACSFIDNNNGRYKSKAKDKNVNINDIKLVENISDNLYIWNIVDDNGFIIQGNDERIESIIGYSDGGQFDRDNIPDGMKEWLDGWTNYIDKIQGDNIINNVAEEDENSITNSYSVTENTTSATTNVTSLQAISPLLSCKWNQTAPFNNQCPIYTGTTHASAGCVGVALGQVLYYYKPTGCKYIDGYTSNNITVEELPATTFNWDIIQPFYKTSTGESANEVAKLMRYCSQACNSLYGSTTGAYLASACDALKNYFSFSDQAKVILRTDFTANNWSTILYKELSEGRPVMMTGYNDNSGHCFVCDGYDGNGLYHINWGWSGLSNGYFMIDYLNPKIQSTGGSNDGYSMNNRALVGIKMDNTHCSADDISSDSNGSYVNFSVQDIEPYLGMEKVNYNITYKATINNTGSTMSTPIYVYIDNSYEPATSVGMNIDKGTTGYAYFNVSFSTAGTHTITIRNTYNKVIYNKTVNIEDVPSYSVTYKYSNVTKITNGNIYQDSYSFKYYLTNNSSVAYNDYAKFDLYRIVSYTTDANGNTKPDKAILMNSKMVRMYVASNNIGSCSCSFDDLIEGEQYYVMLQYITNNNGTVKWTGARTAFFTCNLSTSTINNMIVTPPLHSISHTYTIDGKTTHLPHGIYITNGKKYISK